MTDAGSAPAGTVRCFTFGSFWTSCSDPASVNGYATRWVVRSLAGLGLAMLALARRRRS